MHFFTFLSEGGLFSTENVPSVQPSSEQWWKHSRLINLLLQLSCSSEGDGDCERGEGRWHLETLGRESGSGCTLRKESCQECKKYIWVALNRAIETFLIFEVFFCFVSVLYPHSSGVWERATVRSQWRQEKFCWVCESSDLWNRIPGDWLPLCDMWEWNLDRVTHLSLSTCTQRFSISFHGEIFLFLKKTHKPKTTDKQQKKPTRQT